ncbi:MAG: PIN domain-containing protein [Candidatus Aenigmatarchaeota archaeon]
MANKYMLDSSAWIEYFAGTAMGEKVKEFLENEETTIAICLLSIAEISDKFSKENEKFDKSLAFIKSASSIANLTLKSCSEAGKLKAERRKIKKEFGLVDAITYLTAKENSCILVAKDDDFENMDNVILLK